MLNMRPYKSATRSVTATAITEENKKEVANKLGGDYQFVNGSLYQNGREVPTGDYFIIDSTTGEAYTDSDGNFKRYFCPTDIPERDQKLWTFANDLVKQVTSCAEEAIESVRKSLGE